MVTGLTATHCCVMCQRKPGQHGPRCERRLRKCRNCDFAVTMADSDEELTLMRLTRRKELSQMTSLNLVLESWMTKFS